MVVQEPGEGEMAEQCPGVRHQAACTWPAIAGAFGAAHRLVSWLVDLFRLPILSETLTQQAALEPQVVGWDGWGSTVCTFILGSDI